jgi:hypothetical protein
MNATIVYGPQGCGKTRHAQALCVRYGCTSIVDDRVLGLPLTDGALHLTQDDCLAVSQRPHLPPGLRIVDFKTVRIDAEHPWGEPNNREAVPKAQVHA